MSNEPIDPKDLRRTLGQFATGVTVITTRDDDTGQLFGRTANSFSSVSLDPPLILWSINTDAASAPAYSKGHFAVNILSEDQTDISGHFATSQADKFAGIVWEEGLGGTPVLPDCSAVIECEVWSTKEAGDHIVIIGKVLRHRRDNRPGLAFSRGSYGTVSEHSISTKVNDAAVDRPHPNDDFLIPLLFRAYESVSEAFAVELRNNNANRNQFRLLTVLSILGASDLAGAMRSTFLGENITRETLKVLISSGYVVKEGDMFHLTGPGQERLDALVEIAQDFEKKQLKNVTETELDKLKASLRALGGVIK